MNELCELCLRVSDGQTLTLEKDKFYHVYPEDSFSLTGCWCSNSASRAENPNGARTAALYFRKKRGVTINGNGATVLVHGKMTPFLFDQCDGITVRDLTVDYACPTMSEFTVLSNEDGVCTFRVHSDSRFRVDGHTLFWRGEDGLDGKPYWEQASNADRRHVKAYDPARDRYRDFDRDDMTFDNIEVIDAHTLRVTLHNRDSDFVPGHVYQTRNIVRDQSGALFNRSRDLTFERLRVKFMHGLGMVAQFCENVTFRDCDFTPADGRTCASTADFFQFSGCRGTLLLERCKAHGAHDDHVNVHGTHLRIVETDGRRMTVRFMHPETWGLQAFETGDRLEFIRWDTLQPFAEAAVVSQEKRSDTDVLLMLDREVPDGVIVGRDVVENVTWTPDLFIRGCDFGANWGRGVLCTARGEVVIEHNRFTHIAGPALLVEDDCNFWFESGCTRHITFRKNTVIGCGCAFDTPDKPVIRYAPKVMDEKSEAFVHGKLTLTGNTFREPNDGKHTVWLEYLAEAEIADNTSDAPLHVSTHRCGKIENRQEKTI